MNFRRWELKREEDICDFSSSLRQDNPEKIKAPFKKTEKEPVDRTHPEFSLTEEAGGKGKTYI